MTEYKAYDLPDINEGYQKYLNTEGAVLLDVRAPYEYVAGHIEKGLNFPLQLLDNVPLAFNDRKTPIFVYCSNGNRAYQALTALENMGYTNAQFIGSLEQFQGALVK